MVPLGGKRSLTYERMQFYSGGGGGLLAVCRPFDDAAASVGNGQMLALNAPSKAAVDGVHAAALAAGGTCEGPPGQRMDNFYGAYFRDLDGNKLCVYAMT